MKSTRVSGQRRDVAWGTGRTPGLARDRSRSWKALLIDARDLASPAQGCAFAGDRGGVPAYGAMRRQPKSYETRLLDFQHALREVRPADFPLQGDAITWAVEGFMRWGRAFIQAPSPEVRGAFGPALAAGAEALIDLMDEAEAARGREHTRRIMGEARED